MMQNSVRPLVLAGFARRWRPPDVGKAARPGIVQLPSAPSCSRWLTCSCCRSSRAPDGDFFSHNPLDKPSAPTTNQSQPVPKTKPPALPLPPRLPYSPTSHPYKRHLEALSRALMSDPQDSWSVYLALHPDLRRYIPDDIFRGLILHQLEDSEIRRRWSRVKALLQLAKACGMEYSALGGPAVEKSLSAGMECVMAASHKIGDKESTARIRSEGAILERLWNAVVVIRGRSLSRVDKDIRQTWLWFVQLHSDTYSPPYRTKAGGRVAAIPSSDPLHPLHTLETVVQHGAAYDLKSIDSLIKRCTGDPDVAIRAICCAAQLMTDGMDVSEEATRRCFAALLDGTSDKSRMEMLREQLGQVASPDVIASINEMAMELHTHSRAADKNIDGLLHDKRKFSTSVLLKRSMAIVRDDPDYQTLEKVLQICRYIASNSDDWVPLYDAIITACHSIMNQNDRDISRLVIMLAEIPPPITSPLSVQIRLFHLLVNSLDALHAYTLLRSRYVTLRSTSSFSWKPQLANWRRLFRFALAHPRRHTQFASRLYNDLLADGARPPRRDALTMITALGRSWNASRAILLERHIRDYLELYPGATDIGRLVDAVVAGLVEMRGSDNALLGYTIARRLLQGQPMSDKTALSLVECLALSPEIRFKDAMVDVIQHAPPSPLLARMYDIAIISIVSNSTPHPELRSDAYEAPRLSSPDALDRCVALYHSMTERGVRVSARTISGLIGALVEARRLDIAIEVFRLTKAGYAIKSWAVGRLMVNLAMRGRLDEAESVEKEWRESVDTESKGRTVYDRGVVGAGVLVRALRGEKVDIDEVYRRTGWKGSGPFLRFVGRVGEVKRRELGLVEDETVVEQVDARGEQRLDQDEMGREAVALDEIERGIEGVGNGDLEVLEERRFGLERDGRDESDTIHGERRMVGVGSA